MFQNAPDLNLNQEGLRAEDVAQELADSCFTEDQKEILEYTQGKIKISIADQIIGNYAGKYLLYNKLLTIKKFAQILHEREYMIEDMKRLQATIVEIKNPQNYSLERDTNHQNLVSNKGNSKSTSTSKSVNIGDSNILNDSNTFQRVLTSHPNKVIAEIDKRDDTDKVNFGTKLNYYSYSGDTLNIIRAERNIEKLEPKSDGNLYHSQGITGGHEKAVGIQTSMFDARSNNEGLSEACNITTGLNNAKMTIIVKADANLRSLMAEIPKIRSKFWLTFQSLFTNNKPCLRLLRI